MQRACACNCCRGVVAVVMLLLLVVGVWRSDAVQWGGEVTSVCNGAQRFGSCSTVEVALSAILGREMGVEDVLDAPTKGAPEDSVCSKDRDTCCSPVLQGDLATVARDEFQSVFVQELSENLPHQCFSMEPAVLKCNISDVLAEYITFQTQLISASICTIHTLAQGFEDFISSIAMDTFLSYTNEEIVRLYFNVMVDFFNIRIQDPIQYRCVRDYVENMFGEQIDRHAKRAIVFLAKLQLLLKTSQELSTFYKNVSSSTNWLSSRCINKLTGMTYCRVCSGYVCFKPCRPYCLDTIEGCLTGLTAAVSTPLQDALELLQALREDIYNSADALPDLAYHIHNEYLPSLIENKVEIREDLWQCQNWKGQPVEEEEEGATPSSAPDKLCHSGFGKLPSRPLNLEGKLDGLALPWLDCLSAMLPTVTTLTSTMCRDEQYSGPGYQEWNCWNGTHLGRYSKQVEVPVADDEVHLMEEEAVLSLAVWRGAMALDALNSCTNSSHCISAYSLSQNLLPVVTISVESAENEITSPLNTRRWDKTPQLVLVHDSGPPLPNYDMVSSTTSAPVSLDSTSSEGVTFSSGQRAMRALYPFCLLLVLITSVHLY